MDERALSALADVVVGASLAVAFRDAIMPSPNVGWVVVGSGVGMVLLAVAGVALPNATLLGKGLGPAEKPRWLSSAMLALGGLGLLSAVVAA